MHEVLFRSLVQRKRYAPSILRVVSVWWWMPCWSPCEGATKVTPRCGFVNWRCGGGLTHRCRYNARLCCGWFFGVGGSTSSPRTAWLIFSGAVLFKIIGVIAGYYFFGFIGAFLG